MENEAPGILLTAAAFIGGFSILVFIHEWGHYAMARYFGVKVETFSIGFGKELFHWKDKAGTRWRIALFPLGGYVKFFGDATGASNPSDVLGDMTEEQKKVSFHYKPLWQRALVVAAGPAVNLIVPVFVFAAYLYSYGMIITPTILSEVMPDSAASKAGFQAGDKIIAADGDPVERFRDVAQIVRIQPGGLMDFQVERNGQEIILSADLDKHYMEDRFGNKYVYGSLGVRSIPGDRVELNVFSSIAEGGRMTIATIDSIFETTGQLIMGLRSMKEMGGPIRIIAMSGEAAQMGLDNLIRFLALISINLGIVNLLPIPVLDGGHLLFYGLEAIKGKPLGKMAQEASFVAGFALILFLMVILTLNDLHSLAL